MNAGLTIKGVAISTDDGKKVNNLNESLKTPKHSTDFVCLAARTTSGLRPRPLFSSRLLPGPD